MSLGMCAGCRRFARFGVDCPFCGGAVSAPPAKKPGRRARNGVLAAAAITAAACGGTTSPGDAGSDAREDYNAQPPYGAPAYGITPIDSGMMDAPDDVKDASDEDSGGGSALYGAPPPPDGG